jgi:LacI family transcriptional regulator
LVSSRLESPLSNQSVTLAHVAAEAGVHASTVSRVLSRPDLIGAPTRHAVQAAIGKLGYVPNRAARQLAGGRIGAIGVLVPDITNPFFAHAVRSIHQCCRRAAVTMLLADTDQRADDELSEARALASSVDGFVVCSPVAPTAQWRAVTNGAPLVFVNRRAGGVASVAIDQRAIVELAVAHLRGQGHRSIAVVRGPDAYWSARARNRAITALDGVVTLGPTQPDFDAGLALADQLMKSKVTAAIAFNDLQALGIMAGYRAAGRSIPGDLSVVGSDDIAAASMSEPALTTIAAPVRELGEVAFAMIEHLLDGSTSSRETSLPVTLTVRSSTAPPPTRGAAATTTSSTTRSKQPGGQQ